MSKSKQTTKKKKVKASPSKAFFVTMLTRDIELKDAILDLLDNCVDGILRKIKGTPLADIDRPYEGFWAKITASPSHFSISDNCGGIPIEIAVESAFRLGRADTEKDKGLATVGMYGIGMKRALFKMGQASKVISQNEGDAFEVSIPTKWLKDDDNWDLQLDSQLAISPHDGTTIEVTNLYSNISRQFDESESTFLNDLRKDINSFFTIIMRKGFKIIVNGIEIQASDIGLLAPSDFRLQKIQPYVYTYKSGALRVELVIGFYRKLAAIEEIESVDSETDVPRTTDNAGWTVICNDRVVLFKDKTNITGWGTNGVPNYHTQFIAIAGVARFYSTESLLLPLTTTKRSLDTSSPVYWKIHKFMSEGLKRFTDFTNRWKGREEETAQSFEELSRKDTTEIVHSIPEEMWSKVRGSTDDERKFVPELPRPERGEDKRRVAFFKRISEINEVAEFLFGNLDVLPSDVGERCFDEILTGARGDKQ